MENAFAYVRISTHIQEEKNTQKTQERVIKNYANLNKINIVNFFYDIAYSGKDIERPSFKEMFSRIHEVDSILVFDLSRLSRNFEDSLIIMMKLQDMGKKLYSVSEGKVYSHNDRYEKLIFAIKAFFNEHEKEETRRRIKEGIARFREEKDYWGAGKNAKKFNVEKYVKLHYANRVSKSAIARIFGITRKTLYNKLKLNSEEIENLRLKYIEKGIIKVKKEKKEEKKKEKPKKKIFSLKKYEGLKFL